ncbi:hypothetical protein CC1G_04011 [Coprinopsis cinerea okayama7|uniref:Uncharacterized protein n=1 Tax=Coprinopsis cinerea (strain Okayama-7 / 130 / ATCC MYA-4618 / FGSC 9003) TaxID=240176 RepID=A8N8G4_COPC7|nr:hypothetical protein CC1G_04011 [Coprinopsis cinerea okayama7\|eukprot:XP_001831120.1 hypothetical protein CC1G_04011 [Coprinopsis cinerea okayama7\
MATSAVTMPRIPDNLEQCQPNLMPFRIAYTGPAAISTFMKIRPVVQEKEKTTPVNIDDKNSPSTKPNETMEGAESALHKEAASNANAVDTVVNNDDVAVPAASSSTSEASPTSVTEAEGSISRETKQPTRFISAFRGRTIQGLAVEVPQGYRGVVLKVPAQASSVASTSKSPANPPDPEVSTKKSTSAKPRGRLTRSATSKRVIDVDEPVVETIDDSMDIDDPSPAPNSVSTRNLIPTQQFSSFVVWKPDNPVVEIQDEYIRSLQEWTAIASELHQSESQVAV